MRIYPAIDLKDGQVVRLKQGDAAEKTVYFDNPVEPVRLWREAGARWIHVVDLDGAFSGTPANRKAVSQIAEHGCKVQLGGGLRSLRLVEQALVLGVTRVVVGTMAATEPDFMQDLVREFGGDAIAVGIDARDGQVATRGWVETSALTVSDLALRAQDAGVQTLIYTDIATDGMLTGPNFEAQQSLLESIEVRVIASGGVATLEDIRTYAEMGRRYPHLEGVIVGRALYDKTLDLREAVQLVQQA